MAYLCEQAIPPGYKKISPTCISSDLLSPDQPNRISIPSIGISRAEPAILGGKTWGENVTSYGGIGGLPFLGKSRVRDLDVTRKHTHFSSGLSTYKTNIQPYRRTSLHLSDCRLNDQLVPPTFKVELDPTKITVRDGIPILPYFSHRSKNELFPENDPDRCYPSGQNRLSERTRDALNAYYRLLYETPFYDKTFPDHYQPGQEQKEATKPLPLLTDAVANAMKPPYGNNMMPLLARICVLSKGKPVQGSPLLNLLLYYLYDESEHGLEELYRIVRAFWLFSESYTAKQMELNLGEYPLGKIQCVIESNEALEEKVKALKEILKNFSDQLNDHNAPRKMHNAPSKMPYGDQQGDSPMKLPKLSERPLTAKARNPEQVVPRWPPSKCYTLDHKTMKLRSVDILRDPCPYEKEAREKEGKLPVGDSKDDNHVKYEVSDILPEPNEGGPEFGLAVYKKYLEDELPIKFDDRCPYTEEEAKVLRQWYDPKPDMKSSLAEYEGSDKLGRKTHLPPISLSACLPTYGNRVQDKLGLQFKTEAHKRFHAQFPDSVPDLRDNVRNTKRRVFFYGFHSSAFRG